MTAAGAPPQDDRVRPDEVVRSVVVGIIELLRAFREELTRLQDGAEAFLGRVKGAFVRSLHALQRALLDTILALLFVSIGAVVLAIFLVALLNHLLGDPWGTGVAALALLLVGMVFLLKARANFRTMEREAALLTERTRSR